MSAAASKVVSIESKKVHLIPKEAVLDPGKKLIEEYYDKLAAYSGLTVRKSQKDLSYLIYDSIKFGAPSICEAPTGTGKTLAYLIATIAASYVPGEDEPRPIVVATATVALQDQILNGDLPKLIKAGIPVTYAGIKGRGRYFCLNTADGLLTKKAERQLDFFEESEIDMVEIQDDVNSFLNAYDNEGWSGELDTFTGSTKNWRYVAASPDTCIQNKCEYFEDCPFMKSRKKMNTVQVLVTTQDFVLADLQMKSRKEQDELGAGGGGLLRANYILVVDEAHHFSHKAQELGTANISPLELAERLQPLNAIKANLLKVPQFTAIAKKVGIDFNSFNAYDMIVHLHELNTVLQGFLREDTPLPLTLNEQLSNAQYIRVCSDLAFEADAKLLTFKTFCQGLKTFNVPENDVKLKQAISQCLQDFTVYISLFKDLSANLSLLEEESKTFLDIAQVTITLPEDKYKEINRQLRAALEPDLRHRRFGGMGTKESKEIFEKHSKIFEDIVGTGFGTKSALSNLYNHYRELNKITWVDKYEDKLKVCCTTLGGADLLSKILWKNEKISVAMVSATIGDSTRFKESVGLIHAQTPELKPRFRKFDHIFDYSQHNMYLVMLENSPKFESRAKFIKELAATLPSYIDPNEGTLILFPTRNMLKTCVPELEKKYPGQVLVQSNKGTQALVHEHKQKILEGQGSILCGLDTLSEGLDLPAEFCTHVVICAIPFAAAETPLEQRWQEILKDDYFKKRLLPDAVVKLVQMVGRLLRRESDFGRVTLFDNRFGQRWAQNIIKMHLPPFKLVTVSDPKKPPKGLTKYLEKLNTKSPDA